MDKNELMALQESAYVELKEGKNKVPFSLYETYSAMANTAGGDIYLGVSEAEGGVNEIIGVANPNACKKVILNGLTNPSKISRNSFSESDLESIQIDGGTVIKIHVKPERKENKPVYLNGDPSLAYKRVGDGDKLLGQEEISYMRNDASITRLDAEPYRLKDFSIKDLDQEALSSFLASLRNSGRIARSAETDDLTLLSRAGLLTRGEGGDGLFLSKGAVLFLGKTVDVHTICPCFWLDYQEKGEGYENYRNRITSSDLSHEGNIFNFYRRVLDRLLDVCPAPFMTENGVEIGKKLLIDLLREALANTLSNVDPFSPFGVKIVKTGENLSFENAGTMRVPLPDALQGGRSDPRNQVVFQCFLSLGISDHGGFGIPKIFSLMEKMGFVKPVFTEDPVHFSTKLELNFVNMGSSLSKDDRRILDILVSSKDGLSVREVSLMSGFSYEKTRKATERLLSKGLIEGNGKEGRGRKLHFKKEA